MRKSIFVYSVFPAPYRTRVFDYLSKHYNLFVVFERNSDQNRDKTWFSSEFDYDTLILDNEIDKKKYKNELKKLKSYSAVFAYDYSSPSSVLFMLRCKISNVPYFMNCDGAFLNRTKGIKYFVKRFLVKNALGFFASGSHAKEYFLYYGAKTSQIYMHKFTSLEENDILLQPTSDSLRLSTRKELGLPLEKKIVLSIGQFTHRKGFDVLLKAWKELNHNDSILYIIGGGEQENLYQDIISENKISNVIIDGYKPKSIVDKFYLAADIFVLATREDIWGLVINEAMAKALPVITTDRCIAGLELIEDGENGYIIPNENVSELTTKLALLLGNLSLRNKMASNNLKKISDYKISNISQSHIAALKKNGI